MMGFLLGLPGKITTLMSYLTSARAANLDNLDAAVSTRAVASTALSTANWTAARAGYLDAIPTLPTGIINNVQTGYINATGPTAGTAGTEDAHYIDVTITAAVIAKSFVILHGFCSAVGTPAFVEGRLTTTTNLRIASKFDGTNWCGRWYVVEFK